MNQFQRDCNMCEQKKMSNHFDYIIKTELDMNFFYQSFNSNIGCISIQSSEIAG